MIHQATLFITQKTSCRWYTSGAFFAYILHWIIDRCSILTTWHLTINTCPRFHMTYMYVRKLDPEIGTLSQRQKTAFVFRMRSPRDQSRKSHNAPVLYIPQYTIQNRNVHISVLNGALWDMGHVWVHSISIDQIHEFHNALCIVEFVNLVYTNRMNPILGQ